MVYLRPMETGQVKITCKVLYNIEDEQYHQSVTIKLDTIEPFTISTRYLSLKVGILSDVLSDFPSLKESFSSSTHEQI